MWFILTILDDNGNSRLIFQTKHVKKQNKMTKNTFNNVKVPADLSELEKDLVAYQSPRK